MHKKKKKKKTDGGKKWTVVGIYRPLEYESLRRDEGSLAAAKSYYVVAKDSSLRRRSEPCSGKACLAAANPRAGFKIVLPLQQ